MMTAICDKVAIAITIAYFAMGGITTITHNIEAPNYPVIEQKLNTELSIEIHANGHPKSYTWRVMRPGCDIFEDGFETGDTKEWQRYNTRILTLELDTEGYWVIICRVDYDHEVEPGVKYLIEESIVVKVVP